MADGTDPSNFIGHTFRLFDWTGVTPTGQFNIVSDPALVWDTSKLYTEGAITLVPEPSTLTLLGGLGLVCITRRRRNALTTA